MQIIALLDGRVHCVSMFSPLIFFPFFFSTTNLHVPAQPPLSPSLWFHLGNDRHVYIHTHTHKHTLQTQSAFPHSLLLSYWTTHAHSFLRLRHVPSASSLWVSHHYLERVPVFGHSVPSSQRWTEQLRHRLLVVTRLSETCLITAAANVKAPKVIARSPTGHMDIR